MRHIKHIVAFVCLLAATASAQYARKDDIVLNKYGQPAAGAQVLVCAVNATGSPCSPLVVLHDENGAVKPNPITVPADGNYYFYADPTTKYTIQVLYQGQYRTYKDQVVPTLPGTFVGGETGVAVWGGITGDLSNQADLFNSLFNKVDTSTTVNGKPLSGPVTLSKSDIGLGSVDNTSDASKPISTLTQASLDTKAPVNNPTFTGTVTVPTPTTGTGAANKDYVDTHSGSGGAWGTITGTLSSQSDLNAALATKVGTSTTVNGHALSTNVSVTKADVGLGNADNTSDANKPVSTAQATSIATKVTATAAVYPSTGTIATTVSNVASATALAANGSNCSLGSASSGVDASGNAEGCTAYVQTETNPDWNSVSGASQILNKPTLLTLANVPNAGSCPNLVVTGLTNGASPTCGPIPTNAIPAPSASAFGGVQSKICTGTDKLSAIGNDGVPVCTADQTGAGGSGITSLNGVTLGTQTYVNGSNITITSDGTGGTHTFAFTGICSKARGCTGADNSSVTFPSSGTVATTSLLPITKAQVAGQWLNAYDSTTESFSASAPVKADVGLGNVDNTSDVSKPVSTATQTALNLKANIASPTFTGTVSGVTSAMVGLGNVDNTSDASKPVSTAQQTALNLKANIASPTFTGTVSGVTKSMVGLGSVDNTADTAKPVSTAQQTALDLKANLASPTFTGTVAGITKTMVGLGNVDNTSDASKPVSTATQTALDLKSPIANPTFTGVVTAPSFVGTATTDQSIELPNATSPTVSAAGAVKLSAQSNDLYVSKNGGSAVKVATVTDVPVTGIQAGTTDVTPTSGKIAIVAGSNITVTPIGNTIKIDSIASGSGNVIASPLTTNKIPKAVSPATIADSSISDDGATVSMPNANYLGMHEQASPAGVCDGAGTACGSADVNIYVNSTTHKMTCELGPSHTDCFPSGSAITLTTTGASGVATLSSGTLNIPNYTYTLPAQPWGIHVEKDAGATASEVMAREPIPAAITTWTVATNCVNSRIEAETAATASTTFILQKCTGAGFTSCTQFGSFNFASAAKVATFTCTASTFTGGTDSFRVVAPSSADTTLANMSGDVMGTR